jgi:hemerythrin superfamily protein
MDAVTLLKNDHQVVEQLFRRYESLGGDSADQKKEIVQEVIRELSVHAAIEEQVLYPGVREALPDGDSLTEEALDEHQEAKEVLSDLDGMEPSDPGFDAKVRSLIKDVRHHVEEEETEMFPKLQSAISYDRLEDMGRKMESAKGMAPTRPHPHAPASPPGNLAAGPTAGAVDRVRDAVSGRRKRPTTRKPATKTSARKPAARKSAAKKSTTRGTAKKTTGRKKTAARKRTTRGPVIHVTPDKRTGGWRAERAGSNRPVARGDRKDDVVRKARDSAKRAGGRLVIHKSNGRIQEERTYGADRRRSRG